MVSLGDRRGRAEPLTGKVTDVASSARSCGSGSGLGATARRRRSCPRRVQRADAQAAELGDTVTVSFPQDGPLVLDAKAPVESVEALIAEA